MNTNRYDFMSTMQNKFCIVTNRLNKQLEIIKEEEKTLNSYYNTTLNDYNDLYSAKIRNSQYNQQLKYLLKEKERLEDELIEITNKKMELIKQIETTKLLETDNFGGYTVKGFLDKNFINSLLDGTQTTGYILNGMQYRPDKVATFYYNDASLFWVISLVNNFEGIQNYIEGTQIIIPSLQCLQGVLR